MVSEKNITTILNLLMQEQKKQHGQTMLGAMGRRYNPWKILIGTILSARAKDETTLPISEQLFKKYPTCKALASAKQKDIEKIIKRIGFYRNKAKNIIQTSKILIEQYKGTVPRTMDGLVQLPGVGRKVAGCVLVYAFGKDAIPVDTHVHRVSNRLGWVKTKTPNKTEQQLELLVPKKFWQWVNDLLVWHGKTTCKPITPLCSQCVVASYCKKAGVLRRK